MGRCWLWAGTQFACVVLSLLALLVQGTNPDTEAEWVRRWRRQVLSLLALLVKSTNPDTETEWAGVGCGQVLSLLVLLVQKYKY